MVVLQVTHFLA